MGCCQLRASGLQLSLSKVKVGEFSLKWECAGWKYVKKVDRDPIEFEDCIEPHCYQHWKQRAGDDRLIGDEKQRDDRLGDERKRCRFHMI